MNTTADARYSYLDAPSGRLAYRRLGSSATPLILCNRFRGTIDDWDPALIDVLASERDVIMFDSSGVGRSTGSPADTVTAMAADLTALVTALSLPAPDVFGWSMGGFVAQAFALTQPGAVRRLVIAASKPGLVAAAPTPEPEARRVAGKPVNDDADLLYLFFPPTEDGQAAGRASLARIAEARPTVSPPVTGPAVAAQTHALTKWSAGEDAAWDRLDQLALPVLVAGGSHDRLMDAYHSFAMTNRLRCGTLLLYSDAGHAFLFQHAHHFGRQVLDFLR